MRSRRSERTFAPGPAAASCAAVQDLDAGDLCGHGRIAGYLQLQGGLRDLEVWCELGFVPISAGEEVMFGHGARRSRHLEAVIARLQEDGFEALLERVPYEFQECGNEMLRIKAI